MGIKILDQRRQGREKIRQKARGQLALGPTGIGQTKSGQTKAGQIATVTGRNGNQDLGPKTAGTTTEISMKRRIAGIKIKLTGSRMRPSRIPGARPALPESNL